jgi:ABC-type glutathione transport system ATPase component
MARAILEVRDLWVGDGPGAAVQGVDFVVGPGQVLGVLGGPDAGKSRLLRCVGLDFPPTRGAVFLRGEQVSGADEERRRRLRAGRIELVHPPAPPGAHDATVVRSRASLLGAARPRTLPVAGMRQRIQIAKALTNRAEVLLLDEPFVGVEPDVRRRILELLDRLRREVGTAVVVASRDAGTCTDLADELVELDEGAVVERRRAPRVLVPPVHDRHDGPAERRSA